jgi:hypothetical protein
MRNTINTNPKEDTMNKVRMAAIEAISLAEFSDDPEGSLEDLCAEFAEAYGVDADEVHEAALSRKPFDQKPGCVSNPIVRS